MCALQHAKLYDQAELVIHQEQNFYTCLFCLVHKLEGHQEGRKHVSLVHLSHPAAVE